MRKFFEKLVTETLMNPKTKQWSRKNLAGFIAFLYALYYVTVGQLFDRPIIEAVFLTLMSFAATMLGISSWEKVNIKKDNNDTIA